MSASNPTSHGRTSSSDRKPPSPASNITANGADLSFSATDPFAESLVENARANQRQAAARSRTPESPETASFAKTVVPGLTEKQRYKFTGEFARGGMGRILLAFDRATGREVAIKELIGSIHEADPVPAGGKLEATGPTMMGGPSVVPHAAATGGTPPDEITIERFLREARITSRLEHPNIVPVYEIARRPDGVWYYSMKFVRGVTLGKRLRDIARNNTLDDKGKREERLKLLGSFIDVCNAVAYADSKGVAHRDLKPENIMLGEFGETVILDWGLARVEGEDVKAATQLLSSKGLRSRGAKSKLNATDTPGRSSSRLTLDGSVLGTPSYMPPEQALGKLDEVDHTSDVYSLGAILYEVLSGVRAYPGEDAFDILDAVIAGPPRPLASVAPDVPPELAAVVERAMARAKSARFQSAHELGHELKAWRDGRAVTSYRYSTGEQIKRVVKRHRAVVATSAAALLLLLVGGAVALWSINAEKNEAQRFAAEAENARALAATRLDAFETEKAERERLEAAVADRWRSERERKKSAYDRGTAVIAATMPLELRVADGEKLLAAWEAAGRPEGRADFKQQFQDATMLINQSVGAMERMLALAIEKIEDREPLLLARDDRIEDARLIAVERARLNAAKLVSVKLCAASGDYALARYLLGWAVSTGLSEAERAAEDARIEEAENALLTRRKARIELVLDDVRQGLGREGRAKNAPVLEDYVFELVAYQDVQTAEVLSDALDGITAALTVGRDESKDKEAATVRATQYQRDLATLCCRVMARLGMGKEVVGALGRFAKVANERELAIECAHALGATGLEEAWQPLADVGSSSSNTLSNAHHFSSAFQKLPLLELPPNPSAEELSRQAQRLHFQRSNKEALELLERSIALDGGDTLRRLGLVYYRVLADDHAGALVAADALLAEIAKDPGLLSGARLAALHNRRGLALAGLERYAEAVDAHTLAFQTSDEGSAMWLTNRGRSKAMLNDPDGAFDDYSDAIHADPEYASAWLARSHNRQNREDFAGAIDDATRAILLEPQNANAYGRRGDAKSKALDYAGAISDFSQAIALKPRFYEALIGRASAKAAAADYAGALVDVDEALAAADTPADRSSVPFTRAMILDAMGRGEEAMAVLDAAIAIAEEPNVRAHLLRNRAEMHDKRGDQERAREDFNQAVAEHPTGAQWLISRGEWHREQGDLLEREDKETEAQERFLAAVADFTAALLLDERKIDALNLRGIAYRSLKKPELAIKDYTRMLDINRRSLAALNNRALLYLDEKRIDDAIADFTRAIEIDPRATVPLRNRANQLHKRGEHESALRDYRRIVTIEPENFADRLNIARCLYALDRFEEALDVATEVLGRAKTDSERAVALAEKGRILNRKGDHKEALDAYSAAVPFVKDNAEIYYNRALVHIALKEYLAAIADCTTAIDLATDNAEKARYLSRRAQLKYEVKDVEGELADYALAIDLDPDNPECYNNRGNSLRAAARTIEQLKVALADFDKAISLDETQSIYHWNRGRALRDMRQFADAIKALNKAIDLNDKDARYYYHRGLTYGFNRMLKEAIADYDTAIRMDPEFMDAYYKRAPARNNVGDFKGAIEDANKLLSVSGRDGDAYYYRGFAKIRLRLYDDALEDLNQAAELPEARENSGVYLERASVLRKLRQFDKAEEDFKRIPETDSRYAAALFERANDYLDMSKYPEAIAAYNDMLKRNPNDSVALANRGIARLSIGEFEDAIKDFDDYEAKAGKHFLVVANRGSAKFQLGRLAEAIVEFNQALTMEPKNELTHRVRCNAYAIDGKVREALADAKWLASNAKGDELAKFAAERVPTLEKLLALEPWLTKSPTTPEERVLKAWATVGFTAFKDQATWAAAATELQSVLDAWKSLPLSDPKQEALAKAAEALGFKHLVLHNRAETWRWFSVALERKQWLASANGTAYDAACAAALMGKQAAETAAKGETPPEPASVWYDRALDMLKLAAEEGYTRAEHANTDNDLATIRDDPRFGPILDRIKANEAAKKAEEEAKNAKEEAENPPTPAPGGTEE